MSSGCVRRSGGHGRLLGGRLAAAGALLLSTGLLAQTQGRLATTTTALIAEPGFFHGKSVAVHAPVTEVGQAARLEVTVDEAALNRRRVPQIFVLWRERPSRSEGEIRGEFWDLGLLNADDARLASHDVRSLLEIATEGRWPGRDELFVILGAAMSDARLPDSATLRALALAPERYANREVTVSGRFRGRNLYADLPSALNKSKWDFVLRSADAAVWVSGLRPQGKGFNLDPGARVDTGQWLQVTGTARVGGEAVWIEAREMAPSAPPEEVPVEVAVPIAPPRYKPAVVFSAPVQDDAGVDLQASVRIQFSEDMDPRTFRNRIRVTYMPAPDGTAPQPPEFTTSYNEGARGLTIRFAKPLEPYQTIRVELLDGVAAMNGLTLEKWTLVFSTGT